MSSPFSNKAYRLLWSAGLVAHMTMWMNDVGAAWTMAAMSASVFLIALVQTASTLPTFAFGLVFGAVGDRSNRRRFFIFTQWWGAGVAGLFVLGHLLGLLGPEAILLLVLANGFGLAMRLPVYSALLPMVVSRDQLRPAVALGSVAANAARIVGPLIAGMLLAMAGPLAVYLVNLILCALSAVMLMRWRPDAPEPVRAPTRLWESMAEGLRFIRASAMMRLVLGRSAVFFTQGVAVIALTPVIARELPGAGPAGYGMLLAGMGIGAVFSAFTITRLSRYLGVQNMLRTGRVINALGILIVALAPGLWMAVPGMFVAGYGWVATGNTTSAILQLRLPDAVRARCMSVYQMVVMGSCAVGAAVWGQIVSWLGLHEGMLLSVLVTAVLFLFTHRFVLPPAGGAAPGRAG